MNKNTVGCRGCIKKSENRILLAFLLNLFFSFIEVWGGIVTGSVTIFSDAIHDFGDCIALGMAWRMEKLSKKPPNKRYHFGYRRFSVIAGLMNNLILLAGGVIIIVTCMQRFFYPKKIDGAGMFVFAVFGILINGIAMLMTAKGSNINERTISTHMLEDVLTWGAVLIVGIIMYFFELPILDSLLSIGMTIVIFCGVAKNLKRIFMVLTVRSPLTDGEYRRLKEELEGCVLLGKLENLRLYSMDGEDRNAEVFFRLSCRCSVMEHEALLKKTEECCKKYGIEQVIVQICYQV
ncbi:MAG: cation transporter [Lachnospiraceae bacterium]|nr:cation transporter [Lachnospiraceae bacterium]